MKYINFEMIISVILALVIYKLLDKFVMSKLDNYDEFGNFDGEEYA